MGTEFQEYLFGTNEPRFSFSQVVQTVDHIKVTYRELIDRVELHVLAAYSDDKELLGYRLIVEDGVPVIDTHGNDELLVSDFLTPLGASHWAVFHSHNQGDGPNSGDNRTAAGLMAVANVTNTYFHGIFVFESNGPGLAQLTGKKVYEGTVENLPAHLKNELAVSLAEQVGLPPEAIEGLKALLLNPKPSVDDLRQHLPVVVAAIENRLKQEGHNPPPMLLALKAMTEALLDKGDGVSSQPQTSNPFRLPSFDGDGRIH